MFIKFTRLDGTPIWINSTFVVTVEPRRNGGSVVVPIGDGLDYDVREAPEKVLALIGGSAPAPAAKSEPRAETIAAELARPTAVAEPSAAEPAPEPVSAPVVAVIPEHKSHIFRRVVLNTPRYKIRQGVCASHACVGDLVHKL